MRRIVEHQTRSTDWERLRTITVFEEGISKREARLILPTLSYRGVLEDSGTGYRWKERRYGSGRDKKTRLPLT